MIFKTAIRLTSESLEKARHFRGRSDPPSIREKVLGMPLNRHGLQYLEDTGQLIEYVEGYEPYNALVVWDELPYLVEVKAQPLGNDFIGA